MLMSCNVCAAVNVLDFERVAMGDARCVICREPLRLADDDDELTPLLPVLEVRQIIDASHAMDPRWDEVTTPDPIAVIEEDEIESEPSEDFIEVARDETAPFELQRLHCDPQHSRGW